MHSIFSFFNDTATTVIYTLSLHDALPIFLEWAVPGYREEQIQHLLRGLPKTLRVPLMPLEPKAKEIAAELQVRDHSLDRKSTRLNSSHPSISYAVFCLKKKKNNIFI